VRFKTAAIGALLKQLRYASQEARLKQIRAAEQLARDVDPAQTYPEEFVVYRITGYRPESSDTGAMLVGAALQGDLAWFVTELSKELALRAEDEARQAIPVETLAKQWGVSLKSIGRYRHRGLMCHMVQMNGEAQLACFADEADRFASAHPDLLRRAAAFRRMDDVTVRAIIDEARRLKREQQGISLNKAARRLAQQHGRSIEAVRGVLQRHDAQSEQPIFLEPGPLSVRQRRVMDRAWRMGMSGRSLARRFGKSMQTVHRVLNAERMARLRACSIAFVNMPTFERADADDVILSPRSVRNGLLANVQMHEAFELLEACRGVEPADESIESQRLAAYNWLKRRAVHGIGTQREWPTAEAVDAVEHSLRWAMRLKRALVETALPASVRAIEQALHRPLREQPSANVLAMLRLAVMTTSQTVETFDPARGSTLERVTAFAMGRVMAQQAKHDRAGRAAARHAGESLDTTSLFDALCPWQAWLDVPCRWRHRVQELAPPERDVVERVLGLGDAAPVSVSQAAKQLAIPKSRAAQRLHQGLLNLRRLANL